MLQFGERSQGRICAVNCWCIESAVELRDLGVWVYSSLKVVRPVDKVVMQVFGTLTSSVRALSARVGLSYYICTSRI